MENTLKPCPFCGSIAALTMTDAYALEMCMNSDQIECPAYEGTGSCCCYTVCCDVNNGGCGAAGGFSETKPGAVEKWNNRAI